MLKQRLSLWYSFYSSVFIIGIFCVLIHSFYSMDYDWNFKDIFPYIWLTKSQDILSSGPGLFLQGLWITIKMSFESICFGSVLGFLLGFILTRQEKISKYAAFIYVDIFRNTPVLVQLYVVYFIVGKAFDLSGEASGVLTMSLFCGAYVAEIFRGTLEQFDKGQWDAAQALGLSPVQIGLKIVAPQALRRMLPPLIGQFVSLVKDSSLLSIIAIPELTKQAQNAVTVTFRSFETWFFVALLYFIVNTFVSSMGRWLERHLGHR